MRRLQVVVLGVVLLAALLAGGLWAGKVWLLARPAGAPGPALVVEIPKGAGLQRIAELLAKAGVVQHAQLFLLAAFITQDHGRIKAGEYELSPAMSNAAVLEDLRQGRVKLHAILLPEGFTLRQIVERLASFRVVQPSAAQELAQDPAFLGSLGIKAPGLEGYLFPDTYRLPREYGARAAFAAMVRRFQQVWQPLAPAAQAQKLSRLQAVTLASIIEKETSLDRERPLVSAVYHNRLKRGMPLQADPTVIYGLGPQFDGNLTRDHLEKDTPYNTYTRPGLPPGPICSPGAASLKAAVLPAEVPYLYFVAKGDGSHVFNVSYEAHRRAVNLYQRRGRKAAAAAAPAPAKP